MWRRGETEEEHASRASRGWRVRTRPLQAAEASTVVVESWDDELPKAGHTEEVTAELRRRWANVGPATRHLVQLLAFAGAVIGAIAGLLVMWMHVVNDPLADAHAYYEAAARLNAGQALYPAGADPNGNHIYLYPPLLAIAMRPLALLGFPAFAALWEGVVLLSFVVLVRYLGARRRRTWIAIGLLGVPIGWALSVAQAHVPFTLLLALGQPWTIAIAANLKLTPVLIAIWWLGRRDWESFFAFLVWLVLLALVQVGLDWKDTLAFFSNVGVDQLGDVRNWSPFVQSPVLWAAVAVAGVLLTLALARTRWGWAAAVTLVTLSPPRLLVYMFMGLLAGIREPRVAGAPDPDAVPDVATAYTSASR
jgi:hypothetical protein